MRLRYAFWLLFGAFVSYLLASKANSVVGLLGAVAVIAYGALIGAGIAIATSPGFQYSTRSRSLFGMLWLVLTTGAYVYVFLPVSNATLKWVIIRGLTIGLVAPVIWALRGISVRERAK